MDSITNSYLDNFVAKLGLDTTLKESVKFEHFCAYTMLSQEINSNLLKTDLEAISTGDSKGVDTIAFCINGKLILTEDEIDNFDSQNLFVDVYFFQAKTTECFSDAELGGFLDVVIDFFSDKPVYNIAEFEEKRSIYSKLISKVANIRKFDLHCLYMSLGQKQEAQTTIDATKEIKRQVLNQIGLFSNIIIELIDKSTLINTHRKAISPLQVTFKFENKTSLSGISNVDEAYIGFLPFSEFKNLIMDNTDTKIKSLFNDNLRDFLGLDNPINQGIKKTLENGKFNEFSLLNNGVTVIADANIGKSNTFILENYQIVNGCQTSNVLFECKDIQNIDSVLIPLKIVITKDEDLRDEIILTTNSQSRFTEEQLFAITQFQKTLEDYYKSNKQVDNLYYERRTNQFASAGISRSDIIEIREQLKSFMAMFFDLPHLVAGNIGKIVTDKKDDFFQKEHSPIPYYISGLISTRWDKLLSKHDDLKKFNKYRYHIFMGFRYLVENLQFQPSYLKNYKNYSVKITDNKRENSFDKLLETIRTDDMLLHYLNVAVDVFKKLDYSRPKGAYSNPITREYIKKLQEFINADTSDATN
jgi:hypothetical protein